MTYKTRLYQGRVLDLNVQDYLLPNGALDTLEVIHHQGGAAVLPLFENGDLLLIKQYRAAVGQYLWEIPAGKIEAGEDPKNTAHRELIEETGYSCGELHVLGEIWTTPGFCNEKIYLYLAKNLEQSEQSLEHGEVIEIHRKTISEISSMIQRNEIPDSKTLIALQNYLLSFTEDPK